MVTRIRELLESKELSPTQFADLIGIGRPVVSHILSERNKPSLDVVQRIVEAFPEISLPWLLKGTGDMLADAPAPPATPEKAVSPVAAPAVAAALPASPLAAIAKPFRAPRFVPAAEPARAPVAAATPVVSPPTPLPTAQPTPPPAPAPAVEAPRPAETTPVAPPVVAASTAALPPASASGPADAALLPFLAEPGKAIRRIVIFYRDGSFADYQPEV